MTIRKYVEKERIRRVRGTGSIYRMRSSLNLYIAYQYRGKRQIESVKSSSMEDAEKLLECRLEFGPPVKYEEAIRAPGSIGDCPICTRRAKLVQDHCHQSGNLRSKICGRCNSLLGFANDNIKILNRAITYLTEHAFGVGHRSFDEKIISENKEAMRAYKETMQAAAVLLDKASLLKESE